MKTTKLNLLLLLLTLGVFAFSSCEDEFTEEDFLEMQAELAESQRAFDLEKLILEYNLIRENDSAAMVFSQQLNDYYEELKDAKDEENLEALRQAGLLASYTITIEDQRGMPIEGATVSVGGSNTAGRFDVASDATGEAIVADIVIGASPVQVTAPGFVGVSYFLDLGNMPSNGTDYLYIGDKIFPLGRHETSRITLLSADGAAGTFGTVTGTVTVELDVTNLTPELTTDLVIVAYVDGSSIGGNFYSTSVSMSDFRFIGEGIGSAAVDNTTGTFSMLLPGTEAGITYNFVVPTFTANQTIAIDERNEVAIAPEYAVVPTTFGPGAGSYDAVSAVSGARAVFTAPPTQGTGFTLAFTQVQAGLSTGSNDFLNDEEQLIGNTLYRLTSRGSGLSSSPTATASGGIGTGGTNATFSTAIAGRITGLNIAAAGTGYAVGDEITVVVFPRDVNGDDTTTDINDDGTNNNNPLNNDGSSLSFDVEVAAVNGTGGITSITLPTTGVGFASDAFFGFGVTQHVVTSVTTSTGVGINANFSVSSVNARVTEVNVATGGSLYTSAPVSIPFTGGNALGGTPTLPALTAVATGFAYNVTPSGGTGYSVLPTMSYNYTPNPIAASGNAAVTNTSLVNIIDGASTDTDEEILPEFTLAAGVPVLRNSGLLIYRTPVSFSTPVAVITPDPSTLPVATVSISSSAGTFGQVTGLSVTNVGSGFASPFAVTIEPSIATAPGSGASIALTGFNALTDNLEAVWTGNTGTVVPGSGYLPNLNRAATTSFSGNSGLLVVSGMTYQRDIVYGTGNRLQNVD